MVVSRYVVVSPNCPDWSKKPGTDFENRRASNFGCATETNLGLMVANPRDLVVGRSPGPADAEHNAQSLVRYRVRKTESPSNSSTGESPRMVSNSLREVFMRSLA